MATAHATPDLLATHASGGLSEGMRLIVASHLALCERCRTRVAKIEALCGTLFEDGEDVAATPACLAGALTRISQDEPAAAVSRAVADTLLPAPLRARLGFGGDDIRWRFLAPGLAHHRLTGFEGEDVRLIRARPGVRIPDHTHDGDEATLILAGRMRDGDRLLDRGDFAFADDTDEHHPEIVGPDPCICLIVLGGRLRFTGPLGRVLNLLT